MLVSRALPLITAFALLAGGVRSARAAPSVDPSPEHPRWSWQVGTGASYGQLIGIPFYGVLVEAGLGGEGRYGSGYVTLDGFGGRTEHGLTVWSGHVGGVGFWTLDSVRLGLGGKFGVRNVARITEHGELSFGSFALWAPLQIDVYETRDDRRFFLGFEPEVDLMNVWSATLGVGARL